MNKKDKISLLIYKKLDKTISEKEEKKLNKYLLKYPELNEEHVLIKKISEELKKEATTPLPENFNVKLRQKLVEYNLTKSSSTAEKSGWFSFNKAATAIVLVLIVGVALSYNSIAPLVNNKVDEPTEEISYSAQKSRTINSSEDLKAKNEDKEFTESKLATGNDILNDKANTEDIELANLTPEVNGIAVYSEDKTEGEYIVVTAKCDISLLSEIEKEETEENTFKISMKDYDKVIDLLKNYTVEINNSNEQTLSNEYFIITLK